MTGIPRSQVHVDMALTNFAVQYMQDASEFIAGQIFPQMLVRQQTNKYHKWAQDAFMRTNAQRRAPGTGAARRAMQLSTESYLCEEWAIEDVVTPEERANADAVLNLERAKTDGVIRDILTRRDLEFASAFMTTGVWGTDMTGVASTSPSSSQFTYWDDESNSDPIRDVQVGVETIHMATGMKPNVFACDLKTHHALKSHPVLTELYKYTSGGNLDNSAIAQALGVDRYVVGGAVYATSAEGASTITTDYAFSKKAFLGYVPPAIGPGVPASGVIFNWTGLQGGAAENGVVVTRRYDEEREADFFRGKMGLDMKVTGAPLGYFFDGTVS